ncbi:unnamed protein product [Ixodes persulcatus]
MASASGDVVPRQQKRKPKNKNTAAQLSAKHGYSPSKKGKTRQDDAPAPIQTRTAFPRKLQFASSNWKLLQETLKIGDKAEHTGQPPHRQRNGRKLVVPSPSEQTRKAEVWFDGVDPILLDPENQAPQPPPAATTAASHGLVKKGTYNKPTRVVAMDCEMVGVGPEGRDSVLARVSLVNAMGHCIYDKFVRTLEEVVDYRTAVSGVRPSDLEKGEDFYKVQKEVSEILNGRILVGHAVHHDLKVLFLSHPKRRIRDTSAYRPFRNMFGGRTPSLKALSERILGVKVQEGEHSSVQDAQATMRCYTMYRKQWEEDIRTGRQRAALLAQQAAQQQDSTAEAT